MTGDTILQILQWAIPSGGLGAVVGWWMKIKTANAKAAKSVHDTYKSMYEDISKLLEETQQKYEKSNKLTEKLAQENQLTRRALNRLSQAIEAIQMCPHAASCPVSNELSLTTNGNDADGDGKPDKQKRQRDRKNNADAGTDKGKDKG